MIPENSMIPDNISEAIDTGHPDNTYRCIQTAKQSSSPVYLDRISGFIDGIEALRQTVYFILHTERYAYPIYSWDYGVELASLFGQPLSYVRAELPRRIREALIMDDRIDDVTDFTFENKGRNTLQTHFTVVSTVGKLREGLEVTV